ncbi:hypothetical protein L210DRAFT_3631153 [Boletus edulis BED1]|uniref:Uncharacterized protein n=1 Tax=Boletus edulis BED1 TaxID=1328754 RepID=A0AAD4BSP2_BOLED|nr:hypothetical protein L210DRAFT_3631153 [Boletus edulis BED1]
MASKSETVKTEFKSETLARFRDSCCYQLKHFLKHTIPTRVSGSVSLIHSLLKGTSVGLNNGVAQTPPVGWNGTYTISVLCRRDTEGASTYPITAVTVVRREVQLQAHQPVSSFTFANLGLDVVDENPPILEKHQKRCNGIQNYILVMADCLVKVARRA